MTDRILTAEEVAAADAQYRRMWLHLFTLGLVPKPKPEREMEAG